MVHLEDEVGVGALAHLPKRLIIDIGVIGIIGRGLSRSAEGGSEHDHAPVAHPRVLRQKALLRRRLPLVVEEVVEPGHAGGQQRLLFDAEHLGVNIAQLTIAHQGVVVASMGRLVGVGRTRDAETGIAHRLEPDAGMPYLDEHRVIVGIDEVEDGTVVVDEDVAALGNGVDVLDPGEEVLVPPECVAVPLHDGELLVETPFHKAVPNGSQVLRRLVTVLLKEQHDIVLRPQNLPR